MMDEEMRKNIREIAKTVLKREGNAPTRKEVKELQKVLDKAEIEYLGIKKIREEIEAIYEIKLQAYEEAKQEYYEAVGKYLAAKNG